MTTFLASVINLVTYRRSAQQPCSHLMMTQKWAIESTPALFMICLAQELDQERPKKDKDDIENNLLRWVVIYQTKKRMNHVHVSALVLSHVEIHSLTIKK